VSVKSSATRLLALALAGVPGAASGADIPGNLVVDVRIYEARSTSPDFRVMENLSFFVETDGTGVSESQWLATIARQVPEAFLATLASETVDVEGSIARFVLQKRTRALELTFDLKDFLDRGTFAATSAARLARGDETVRAFDREIELRVGHTYVFASRDFELSASEYLSHFRDFENAEERGELYESLRGYTFFLVVAVTPHLAEEPAPGSEPVAVPVGANVIPPLESPLGIPLIGEIVLAFDIDSTGAPTDAWIVRSSIPEVNSRVLGETSSFRFPDAAGRKALLTLSLRAEP
jgi:hypothetical protein